MSARSVDLTARPHPIHVVAGHLCVEGEPILRREEIASAFSSRAPGRTPHLVCLDGRGERALEVEAEGELAVARALEALGFDDGKPIFRVLALPIEDATGSVALFGAAVVVAMMLGVAAGDPDAAQVFAVTLALFVYGLVLLMPSYVAIGAEGLRVTWLRRERFVSYADVGAVTVVSNRVEVHLKTGETLAFEVLRGVANAEHAEAEARLLRTRLAGALGAYTTRAHADASAVELVARAGRSAWAWLGQLRNLVSATYRGAALVPERLWRVLEDPAAPPSARVAAAAALRPAMDGRAREHVRALARSSVVLDVRAGLEAVVDAATDDDLLAALEPCDAAAGCGA